MRVLHLFHEPDLVEFKLIEALVKAGIELTVVIKHEGRFKAELVKLGIDLREYTFRSRLSLNGIFFLRSLVKQHRFDIVHSFSARALSCALLATFGTKIKHVAYRGTSGHLSRLDPTSWLTYLSPRLAKIICVSNSVRGYLLSIGIPEARLVTIYKGHDPNWYAQPKQVDLSQYGVQPGSFTIVCVANMRPVKGVDVLVEAFSLLSPKTNTELLLIGALRDPEVLKAINRSARKDRIHVIGPQSEVTSIISSCQVFVMPSRKREGLPKAVLEAMCCKVPVIVSAIGGMREIIRDGIDGLVVTPEDPNAIKQAIEKLVSNPSLRDALGTQALNRVTHDFNILSTISKTVELYRAL